MPRRGSRPRTSAARSQPTWINWTGGDTLYSVAATGPAVYVGGHQRWLDNPLGRDSAGPGAVSRPGIGAIDPVTGRALAWNPTKSREHGTMVLFATPSGLWVGSDGANFGHEEHAGIGFAPLDPGPTPDTTRPNTFIDSGPSGSVTDTSATFSFSANEPSTFQCRLDGGAFAPCTSPTSYADLTAGSHTFQVAAIDGSFNVDASPAERTWTVVDAGQQPGREPGVRGGHVRLEGRRGGQHAEPGRGRALGRLGRGGLEHPGRWQLRARRQAELGELHAGRSLHREHLGPLGHPRAHAQAARARVRERRAAGIGRDVDGADLVVATGDGGLHAGRAGTSSLDFEAFTSNSPVGVCFQADDASITFATPDTIPPDTVIDSGPSGSVFDTSATFSFSATEPSTFQCRLDGAAFAPCTSPTSYANLATGTHTFQVAATDGSSNVDASPAERSWTVLDPPIELVGNPGFEVDTSGWAGDASANTLSRVAGGHSGGWAAAISNTLAGGNCGLNDKPNWVSTTGAGAYTARIWARSDTPGLTLKLRIREFASGVQQGSVTTSLALTSSWQQVTAAYTPVAPGLSTLDFEAFTANSPVGVCFQADDASITH